MQICKYAGDVHTKFYDVQEIYVHVIHHSNKGFLNFI